MRALGGVAPWETITESSFARAWGLLGVFPVTSLSLFPAMLDDAMLDAPMLDAVAWWLEIWGAEIMDESVPMCILK